MNFGHFYNIYPHLLHSIFQDTRNFTSKTSNNIVALIFSFFLIISFTSSAIAETSNTAPISDTQLISIEASNEDLSAVIKRLSAISNYNIVLERQWQDYPVSIKLHDVTLEQALLEILGKKINHAIIWRPDRQVSIIMSDIPLVRKTIFRQKPNSIDTLIQEMPPGLSLSGRNVRYQQASPTATY